MRSVWPFSSRVMKSVSARRVLKAAALAGGLAGAQLTYLQYHYVPLEPPVFPALSGIAKWAGNTLKRDSAHVNPRTEGDDQASGPSRRRKTVLIIGDSLVVGIGCKYEAVMPKALCDSLAEHLQADISWFDVFKLF